MSGVYDLSEYTKGYWDERVYYNSPIHYVPNLTDSIISIRLKQVITSIFIPEVAITKTPEANRRFSGTLGQGNLARPRHLRPDIKHDWPTWRQMLPYIIDTKF